MRTRQRTLSLLFAGILVATGGGACSAEPPIVLGGGEYTHYSSAELIAECELIVHGMVESTRVEEWKPTISDNPDPTLNPQAGLSPEELAELPTFVVTVVTVRVIETIKGDVAPGELIEVYQMGGLHKGVRYVEYGTAMMTADRKNGYLLFLNEHPGSPYGLPNPQQALFLVDDNGGLEAVGGELSLPFSSIEHVRAEVAEVEKAAGTTE